MKKSVKDFFRYYGYFIIRHLFSLMSFIPIKDNRYIFMSYLGEQYSCNPKAISVFLRNENNLDLIWVLNKKCEVEINQSNVRIVRPRTLKFYYYYWTCKFIFTNGLKFREVPIRPNQTVLNTWHGGGAYKRVVFDNPSVKRNKFEKKLMVNPDKDRMYYLSSCKLATEYVIQSGLGHYGRVLETGSPRNDIFFSTEQKYIVEKVKEIYGVSNNRVFLYAPTFRDSLEIENYSLDFSYLKEVLSERFGGKWEIFIRMHHLVKKNDSFDGCISVSDYPDMQDLLVVADAFLTDYSSSLWDYSFTGKPGFLYVPDLSDYERERNFYVPIAEWPYDYATSQEELYKLILNYNQDKADVKIKNHHKMMGSFETGNACGKLMKIMRE